MKKLVSIAILSGLWAATAHAQAQADTNRSTVSWSDPSRPGTVKVTMLSGTISVRAHGGKDVLIESSGDVGRNRRPDRNAEGLTRIGGGGGGFNVEEANNVITISSPLPRGSGGSLDIQVPAKTNLQLNTVNGRSISVDSVEGDIEVTNQNGDVHLTNVSGSVVAHSQNGQVIATVRDVTANKPMSFSSFNGKVDVTLPPTTKANLKIRTDNGEAWSDFDIKMAASSPATVENNRGGRGFRISFDKTNNGTINGGGPDIELRTFHGNVYLRKAK